MNLLILQITLITIKGFQAVQDLLSRIIGSLLKSAKTRLDNQ